MTGSSLRSQPKDHAAAAGDPGAQGVGQSYTAHYCDVSSPVDPLVVACSFIASGLRVFDISDLTRPKEIAYHVAPTEAVAENVFNASSFSMSKPVIVPERQEVWYSDGATGFHALHIEDVVWPTAAARVERVCGSKRALTVTVRLPKGAKVRSTRATLGGKSLKGARQVGRSVRLRVDLRGRAKRTTTLRLRVRLSSGKSVTSTRRYRTCTKRS